MSEVIVQRLVIPHQLHTMNELITAAIKDGIARGSAARKCKFIGGQNSEALMRRIEAADGYNQIKRQWGLAIRSLAIAARLQPMRYMKMGFLWVYTSRYDPDNLYTAGVKLILDGLRGIVVPSDTDRYIHPPHVHRWVKGKSPSVTVIMRGPVRE